MLKENTTEGYFEIKEYLNEMIEHYKDTQNPLLLERRKTYRDVKIAIFGEDVDDGYRDKKST